MGAIMLISFVIWGNLDLLQTHHLIYPQLDQTLLTLRADLKADRMEESLSDLFDLKNQWSMVQTELKTSNREGEIIRDFILCQSGQISLIETAITGAKLKRAGQLVDQFIAEFAQLRRPDSTYPLDDLWRAYEIHQDLEETVRDPMMGLREWFEFQDLIEKFQCAWEEFELLHPDLIPIYFPDLDEERLRQLHLQMGECISNLFASTDSGFRPDFILPCDRMKLVIEECFDLFLYSNNSDL